MAGSSSGPRSFWVYIGNTTREGIALFKLDSSTGKLTAEGIAAPANSPGFLTISPNQKYLYAGVKSGTPAQAAVQSFGINAKTGRLTPLNEEPSGGDESCYVSVDPLNKNVLAAHFGAATVSVLPIKPDGSLAPRTALLKQEGTGPLLPQQSQAHAHFLNTDPAGNFALSCDYGADKVFIYKFDSAKGTLTPQDAVKMPPGSAPRHLTFHPNGKWVYVLNELNGTIGGFSYDGARGTLDQIEIVSAMKEGFKGKNRSAEVQIHPNGRFLYASHRDDTNFISIFSINSITGQLKLVDFQDSMGKTPRNFRIDPTGQYMIVANQDSSNIVLFSIDDHTGKLKQAGEPMPVGSPICVKFLAAEE